MTDRPDCEDGEVGSAIFQARGPPYKQHIPHWLRISTQDASSHQGTTLLDYKLLVYQLSPHLPTFQ